jgi:hypothetical protein
MNALSHGFDDRHNYPAGNHFSARLRKNLRRPQAIVSGFEINFRNFLEKRDKILFCIFAQFLCAKDKARLAHACPASHCGRDETAASNSGQPVTRSPEGRQWPGRGRVSV